MKGHLAVLGTAPALLLKLGLAGLLGSAAVGTRDYRITVSAVPPDAGRTFRRLSYAYGYGMACRMAMKRGEHEWQQAKIE